MERESFENPHIAQMLNEAFVNVKVDREERPDLDEIYMNFVQAFTGHGGWPMSTFLTPEGKPFFGGTYWPPTSARGMPGFVDVINHVRTLWDQKRAQVAESAEEVAKFLRANAAVESARAELNASILDGAAAAIANGFDWTLGGFGSAPKFPHAMELSFLLRSYKRTGKATNREMTELALRKMAAGGIHDHLGGGFARYSVDARWDVPHFEKMLYDNALLARTYLEFFQISGDRYFADVVTGVFDWVLREMQSPDGGIYSTIDADSEGEEGKFYVWDPAGVKAALGAELGDFACRWFDLNEGGNFEHGKSTLTTPKTLEQFAKMSGRPAEEVAAKIAQVKERLLSEREKRIRPGTDTKILTAWNGLMIAALARGSAVLGEPRYYAFAAKSADFVLTVMRKNGRLLRTAKDGKAHLTAYVEDYACLIEALVDLYEAGFELRFLHEAVALARTMIEHYYDRSEGGFFFTADDAEALIVRSKNPTDNATPSGNSVAVAALLRLGLLTGEKEFTEVAEKTLRLFAVPMTERPYGFANMLCALDLYLGSPPEIAIVGPRTDPEVRKALGVVREGYRPNVALALKEKDVDAELETRMPLLAGKTMLGGTPTFYVCRNCTCGRPATTAQELKEQWG
jgi:hypothetical protein